MNKVGANLPGWITIVSILFLFQLMTVAQLGEEENQALDLNEMVQQRKQIEESQNIEPEIKDQLLELYGQVISELEKVRQQTDRLEDYERQESEIPKSVEKISREVARLQSRPEPDLPDFTSAERLENRLTQERAKLSFLRVALREAEQLSEQRVNRRNEISQSLGTLDQKISSLNDQILSGPTPDEPSLLTEARLLVLRARKEALLSEGLVLRGELNLLEARAVLLPWRRDLAELRVDYNEDLVSILEARLMALKKESALASLEAVIKEAEKVVEKLPEQSAIAEETVKYAEMLWDSDGVIEASTKADRELSATRKEQSDLERMAQLTRRRFEAVGYSGDITQWWPEIPENFSTISEIRKQIDIREKLLPNIQHRLIQLEQERAVFRDFEQRVMQQVQPGEGREALGDLLLTRRELLDSLIDYYGRYSSRLTELVSTQKSLLAEGELLSSYVREKALWVRSVPGSPLPKPEDLLAAIIWLLTPETWVKTFHPLLNYAKAKPLVFVGTLLFPILLIIYRQSILRRLSTLAQRTSIRKTAFRDCLESMILTILLVFPIPFLLYTTGKVLMHSNASSVTVNAGNALSWIAVITALFEFYRNFLREDGFAVTQLRWSPEVVVPISKGLSTPQLLFSPLLYIAILFGLGGMALDTPREMQTFHNSLGRLAFVVALVGLGLNLSGVLRPRKWSLSASRRLSIFAAPALFLTFFLPAFLASVGFYLTGFLLSYQMLRTTILGTIILIIGGIMFRWLEVGRHKLGEHQDGSSSSLASHALSPYKIRPEDAELAETRTRQLAQFILILLLGFGFFSIWSDAVPSLQIINRIQVWPTVELLDLDQEIDSVTAPENSSQSAEGSDSPAPDSPTDDPLETQASSEQPSRLMLRSLLHALLAAIITAVLVANIPGLLEFILLKRAMLEPGARIALSTLARYTIMILGILVTFNMLGIGWSKIHWLAAALTFGLGFGLQEIVANFVSGLILLLERPVRVGDVITIGTLQGKITKTRIRATTITLWDRSEMVVPNKEFITQKLVNWTLSDSKRRLQIPVRVAYGTPIQKVKNVLMQVAKQHQDVLDDPPPQTLLLEFGEDSLKFELRVYLEFGKGLVAGDELRVAIDNAFQENGIEFAIPQLSLKLAGKDIDSVTGIREPGKASRKRKS